MPATSHRRARPRGRREPAGRGARAPAGPADDAGHLRRLGRPRQAQAPARALQPRPRGRAAGALQPDRRRAPRAVRRRVPRGGEGVDRVLLAPRARPAGARRPARAHALRGRAVRRQRGLRHARQGHRGARRGGRAAAGRMYYLSTAPEFFSVITEALKKAGLHRHRKADVRVVIEKPFGTDLESARELQKVVSSVFRERQVFRIDHYLGKETVQNLLVFRFANLLFEPVWNRNYIDHVQITAAEDIGIGTRAGYYDASGALRDLVQNHMLQLLTLLCMEPPASFDADKVRDEKVKVLDAITPPTPEEVERDGARAVRGGLARRRGRPRLPRRGGRPRRLADRDLRGAAARGPQLALGGRAVLPAHGQAAVAQDDRDRRPAQAGAAPRVRLRRLGRRPAQPADPRRAAQRGRVAVARREDPGSRMRIRPVNMEFLYGSSFMSQSPEAYERLIHDAMRGEATLFTRDDEVIAQWSIIDPILKAWQRRQAADGAYAAGSPGPAGGRRAARAARVARAVTATP